MLKSATCEKQPSPSEEKEAFIYIHAPILGSQNQAEYSKAAYNGIKYRPNLIHLSSVPSNYYIRKVFSSMY